MKVFFNKVKTHFPENIVCTILTIAAWHAASAGQNILAKVVLTKFNYPLTVAQVQLLLTAVLTWPALACNCIDTSKKNNERLPWRYWFVWLTPMAFAKVINNVGSQWSLANLALSYVHTVKATQPIFTILFVRIVFGRKQTLLVYLSLITLISGVGIASYSEATFSVPAFLAVLAATCSFTLQNIFSKELLNETGIHNCRLVLILSLISLLFMTPIWVATDFGSILDIIMGQTTPDPPINWLEVVGLLVAEGVLSSIQVILASVVLALVSSLTYSVASATKRIEVILGGIILLHDNVSVMKTVGMAVAVSGVFSYTFAKHRMSKRLKEAGGQVPAIGPYESLDDPTFGNGEEEDGIETNYGVGETQPLLPR